MIWFLSEVFLFTLPSKKRSEPKNTSPIACHLTSTKMVGNIRFLTLVKPVLHVLPEVAQPDRKIPFKVRRPA